MNILDDVIRSYGSEVRSSLKVIEKYRDLAAEQLAYIRGRNRDLVSASKSAVAVMSDASDQGDLGARDWLRKWEDIVYKHNQKENMENGIELMRDDKRVCVFFPLDGKIEVVNISELVPEYIFRSRLLSKEEFDMGITLLGNE